MLREVRTFFREHILPPSRVTLALSGGVDSTALLLAMCDLRADGFDLTAIHVNHRLRAEEGDADQQFVTDLCLRHGVPLEIAEGTLDRDEVKRVGVEAAARDVRLRAFAMAREKAGSLWVATAHQKNDQAETVLMRLLSGGGLGSLRAIRAVRDGWMIRPLLNIGRGQIEAFLQQRGVTPRRDRMNEDERYLRVRARRMLRGAGPEAVDHLASIARQMQLLWPIVEKAIDDADAECAESKPDSTLFIDWPNQPYLRAALLLRHIRRLDPHSRDISAEDLTRIVGGIEALKRQSITGDLELLRTGRGVLLRRLPGAQPSFELSLRAGEDAEIASAGVRIRVLPAKAHGSPRSTTRDAQLFQLPRGAEPVFIVRSRRDGDRFQPLGLERPKKLKDFLIDRKIAAELRDRIPLLLWNDQIVCLAGVEISEVFKVTGSPADLYEVRMEKSALGAHSVPGVPED